METEKLICNSKDITYNKGYITLWCKDYTLPNTFEIDNETLLKKDHFHVSLLYVKNILEINPAIEVDILKYFCEFRQENEMKLEKFTEEFRLAQDADRKSIVALCEVSNLHKFAEYLTEKIGVDVPSQPAHVTIYTLQPNVGIGLNSPEEMEQRSKSVSVPPEIVAAFS